ncbi:MAG: hypothetical protein IPH02_00390 [Sphingobacteriales bacterium]|nr:hypothetical protein [Sphingobacteriales bacterium]
MTTLKNTISHRTGVSTFASHTSPSTGQSLQKSFHLSHADKIELKKISSPSENKKYATTQTNTTETMTVKHSNDNGLQVGQTEGLLLTMVTVAQPSLYKAGFWAKMPAVATFAAF